MNQYKNINKTKNCSLKKITKINKTIIRLTKQKILMTNIRNERKDITTDHRGIKRLMK